MYLSAGCVALLVFLILPKCLYASWAIHCFSCIDWEVKLFGIKKWRKILPAWRKWMLLDKTSTATLNVFAGGKSDRLFYIKINSLSRVVGVWHFKIETECPSALLELNIYTRIKVLWGRLRAQPREVLLSWMRRVTCRLSKVSIAKEKKKVGHGENLIQFFYCTPFSFLVCSFCIFFSFLVKF